MSEMHDNCTREQCQNMSAETTVRNNLTEMQGMEMDEQRQNSLKSNFFRKLAPASLLYALIYTVCLYKNTSGIAVLFWIMATIGYAVYVIRQSEKTGKKESVFLPAVMFLLGVSTFTTGNKWIIAMNYIFFFLLLIGYLLRQLKDEGNWDLERYFAETFRSVFGAIGMTGIPVSDGSAYAKTREKGADSKGKYVFYGVCIAVPSILILGGLLASADMVFANMLDELFRNLRLNRMIRIGWMLLFGFFSSYCGVRYLMKEQEQKEIREKKPFEPVLAITVLASIAVLYLFFCGIQVLYLFVGNMQLPEGMTYAEYARSGFFQLLAVCGMNLILVMWIKKHFGNSKLLDAILLVISFCTMIMTASSAWRMVLYIRAYHLTFLRVSVLTALLVIALWMIGTAVYILWPAFPMLKYSVVTVCVVYLVFAFSHVDHVIASYNLAQMDEEEEDMDFYYISKLSTDAAPAIAAYRKENAGESVAVEGEEKEALTPFGEGWYRVYMANNREHWESMTLRSFNLSYYVAGQILEDLPKEE